MLTFSELLQAAGPLPRIDTVVHLGAGPLFDDELYRQLGAQRHVLLEADPEAAGHLRRSIPDSGFEVRECMVASTSGNVLFHRFSLPALNGPFAVGEISRIYPRLRELESLPMASTATESFFASIALPRDASCALLLDIPGQEADILRALPSKILQQFEVVAVRGAGDPRMQGAALHTDAHTVLAGAGFLQASGGTKSDPLFPLALFRLDRAALEFQALTAERDNATKERDALQAKLAALQSEHSDLVTRQSSLATALEELQGKHSSLLATEKDVAAARDNLTKERDQARAQRDNAAKERDQARAERDNAAKERDTLKKTASDRAMRIAELEAQVADQAERQRQIDEEIAKAEGQLEMLASLFESGASRPR